MRHDSLRVAPGTSVDLSEWPTRSDAAWADGKKAGKRRVGELADELAARQELLYADGRHRLLVVLQAMDTAGKDSTIRDVFGRMNPQGVRVTSFGRPSEEDLSHDYLWRVHPHAPADGHIAVFNRSHYEDVLVVRVDELVDAATWSRRFHHIVEFERMLADEGTTIVKFFIHISREEQRSRLQARIDDPAKHWKFDPGDLETRTRWDDYQIAYAEMMTATSTEFAPWYVIPGDRKWYRKLVIGEIMADLMDTLDLRWPPPEADLEGVVVE